ncbi:MAG TPA: histidine phosphatase family protein, partial [Solirubrobacterales bacterium]
DPALAAIGLDQATALAEWLAEEKIDAIWCSPMRRAQETAAPLAARLGLEVTVEEGIAEYDRESPSYIPVEELKAANDPRWYEVPEQPEHFQAVVVEAIERIVADAAAQKGVEPAALATEDALASLRAWTGSQLFKERIAPGAARTRVEVPLLMQLAGRVIRGSIDLLAEQEGRPPLIVDYKTDRLGEDDPAARAAEYETQRDLYALAVAEATGAGAVEVAYVFLERPDEPAISKLGPDELAAARSRLELKIRHTEAA